MEPHEKPRVLPFAARHGPRPHGFETTSGRIQAQWIKKGALPIPEFSITTVKVNAGVEETESAISKFITSLSASPRLRVSASRFQQSILTESFEFGQSSSSQSQWGTTLSRPLYSIDDQES